MKNIRIFSSEKFQFLVVKLSVYLNRRVFVMTNTVLKQSKGLDGDLQPEHRKITSRTSYNRVSV